MATHQFAVDREERMDARSALLAAPGRSLEIPGNPRMPMDGWWGAGTWTSVCIGRWM